MFSYHQGHGEELLITIELSLGANIVQLLGGARLWVCLEMTCLCV